MDKAEALVVRRLKLGTVFKVILTGNMFGFAIVTTVIGVFSLFGAGIIKWNDQYITGFKGLIASPFIGIFVGLIIGLFTALFTYIGLRLYAMFKPMTIEYIACTVGPPSIIKPESF